MRISSVNIPKSTTESDGLEEIKMDKLGQIVILAGKNGAGKSRILTKISKYLGKKPTTESIQKQRTQRERLQLDILKAQKELSNQAPKEFPRVHQSLSNGSQRRLEKAQRELDVIDAMAPWEFIITDKTAKSYPFVLFVPKSTVLTESIRILPMDLIGQSILINSPGVDRLPQSSIAKMQYVQNRWFNSSHQSFSGSEDQVMIAEEDYKRLQEIVRIFLDTEIGRSIDGEIELFGLPMSRANLSDGQKIILQFCLAIYSQEADLKDIVLVMDEPENHLHPSVIIDLIERIKGCVPNGQIWISTHSVPLLAHFNPNAIWYVDKGRVTHAGRIPEKVLESLLGDESRVAKLQDFISLPAHYASNQYAFECLFEPQAVETGVDDPQPHQIRKSLLRYGKKGKLKVLDFGAGKGRIVSNIYDIDNTEGYNSLTEKIDYYAYDEYKLDGEVCKNSIARVYGNSDKRYYNNYETLLAEHGKESFDVVIMCNVLHEIDPLEWLELFKAQGKISKLLKKSGILLLVEDHQIPIGEKAYQKGFIVLDTVQIKEVFSIPTPADDFVMHDARNDGRLKAHSIPKSYLTRITAETRLKALKDLKRLASQKILSLRRETQRDYRKGKEHGFWTQQYANAELSIAQLETTM